MIEFKIIKPEHFNLKDVLDSGQAFRYEAKNAGFLVSSGNKRALVSEEEKELSFFVQKKEYFDYFKNFFDLEHDYKKDFQLLEEIGFPKDVLLFSNGVRILRQPAEEIVFTFLVSQNNNIKRIKKIINALCERVGQKIEDDLGSFYSFPSAEELSQLSIEELRDLGLGYRDKYIYNSSHFLAENKNFLKDIVPLKTEDARKELLKLSGVGPKVADCVLLFGFNKRDVFPLDVWMEKVFLERFHQEKNRVKMANEASNLYGNLAGLAQQLYFFHIRENNK